MTIGAMNGMLKQRLDYLINNEITHIQIHHPEFLTDAYPRHYIPAAEEISSRLTQDERVRSHSLRTLVNGMLQSPVKTSGVRIRGVNTNSETTTTRFHEQLSAGAYLNHSLHNPLLMGKSLAADHNVDIGHRVVLIFETADNELTAAGFSLHSGLRTRLFSGDLVRTSPEHVKGLHRDPGLVDLSATPVNQRNLLIHTNADRLFLEWDRNDWLIRAGRQRVNWGVNLITNPNDIFNIYSIYAIDYPERPGSDAIRIQRFTSPVRGLNWPLVPDDNAVKVSLLHFMGSLTTITTFSLLVATTVTDSRSVAAGQETWAEPG